MESKHAVAPALILTLVLLVVQGWSGGVPEPKAPPGGEEAPELRKLKNEGNSFYRAGQYLHAIQLYQRGYRESQRRGSLRSAVRFLNNLGSANYQMFHYREAVQAYLQARDLAAAQGDRETLGALCVNLSSLYFQMGENEAALESAEQGLKLIRDATSRFRAKLLIQCARIKAEQRDAMRAAGLLRDAIQAAQSQLDVSSEAQAWNEMGNLLLDESRLPDAERALLEAYRLRKLAHDSHLYFSYESLGRLRELQGDLRSASILFGRAVESARAVSPAAMWTAYYSRGRTKLAQGRFEEAYSDFSAALRCARRWRAEVIPADAFRIGAEVEMNQVYSAFIELGGRLYAQTGRKQFAQEAFAASEESRAASLRALWAGPDLTKKLPNEYWQTLASLHQAETASAEPGSDADSAEIRRLRVKVEEMEARAGLDFPPDYSSAGLVNEALLNRARGALRPSEVFIGFHLGETESSSWVITRERFEFRRLPPRQYFSEAGARFVNALRASSPEAVALGRDLYSQLFGDANPRLLDKPEWIIAPDGPLFETPFAALIENCRPQPQPDAPRYLVERHAIQIVPGISALFSSPATGPNGPVVALGDPIYNRADPRLPGRREAQGQKAGVSGERSAPRMELARLPGTAREIETCARVWRAHGINPILLTGAAATGNNLALALRRNPAVVHVAAHMVFPPQASSPGMIALALEPGAGLELLSATEIASMRMNLGLVVLDSCDSARAEVLPGAGLMGMTRAWLAAGARAVIVTRWATDDRDEGRLFPYFYERLSSLKSSANRNSFALLLQEAQLNELRAGGRRANPAYWAAYFCVQRN